MAFHASPQGIVVLGHSTGCQDAVRYASRFGGSGKEHIPQLLGLVLQAPVSDQEYLQGHDATPRLLAKAKAMVEEGRGEDIVGRNSGLGSTPITARRFMALAERGGDDDMFSTYYSDEELAVRYCNRRFGGILSHIIMWARPTACMHMILA